MLWLGRDRSCPVQLHESTRRQQTTEKSVHIASGHYVSMGVVSPACSVLLMNVLTAKTELIVVHILFGILHRFLNFLLVHFFAKFYFPDLVSCAGVNFGLMEAVRAFLSCINKYGKTFIELHLIWEILLSTMSFRVCFRCL